MSETLTSITASVLESAAARIASSTAWPDLASGFAYRVLRAASVPVPSAYEAALRTAGPTALRRSPELAAFGYVLDRAGPDLHADWVQAFARLTGREVFPADRNGFIYNPLELLGIAVGAAECPAVTPEQQRWLADNVRRGLAERQFIEPVAEMFARCAIEVLSVTDLQSAAASIPKRPATELTTPDLCLTLGLATLCPSAAPVDLLAAEQELLYRALKERIEIRDSAEAAGLYVALRHTIDWMILEPTADRDAVGRVVTLCRRFQLFVDRLQRRQRGRSPFEVKDEYDVQDLLHGILRLHFDDVRPEEWTPSYAGGSSRVDFYLPRERTLVEAKMTRSGLGQKEVADELIIDKERYAKMAHVDHLVCFVYDPSRRCPNPVALEDDLAQVDGRLHVAVVVCPRGM